MKDNILKLRKEGKSYRDIKKILNCSSGTVAYHCGEGQKEKSKNRNTKSRQIFKNYILRRICYFQKRSSDNKKYEKGRKLSFTVDQFIEKFGKITKCALSGKEINLEIDRNWQIDHIIPKSKGGDNSLENCQILLQEVNQMKNDLDESNFILLCKKILENKGYTINFGVEK